MKKYLFIFLSSVLISSCGSNQSVSQESTNPASSSSGTTPSNGNSSNPSDSEGTPTTVVNRRVTIKDGSGSVAAYVMGIGQDTAQIYISSIDRYTSINLTDGSYTNYGYIFYSNQNCTGSVAGTFIGKVGKSVIFGNGKYYLATTTTTNFAYQSLWLSGTCTNAAATQSVTMGALTEIPRPYDFTNLAPISLSFE